MTESRTPHILIVDDIPAVIKIAEIVLTQTGNYHTSHVRSGEEALELIEIQTPDLILMDIQMPGMGGYEACRQLKQSPKHKDIPVIFLTVMDSADDIVTGFEVGGTDYINKPFVPAVLLARVETHLNLYLSQQREQQTRKYLDNILSSMNEGLAIIDPENRIQQVNPKLEHLCNMSQAELKGQPFETLFTHPPDPELDQQSRTLQRNDGSKIPTRILFSSLSSSGADGHKVALINDISKLLDAESIRQAGEAKDNFLASMSHELRTPLTSVIGYSELLLEQLKSPEQQRLARLIEFAGRRQLDLIKDILEVSKIENGEVTITRQPYDLGKMISETEEIFCHQAKQSGLSFEIIAQRLPTYQLLGDLPHVRQALFSIISNAFKFTEKGGVTVTIQHQEETLNFSVEDSGIGIEPELMERLFRRFQQGDSSNSRRFQGTGLGLYIAHTLAELMGGSIEVSSTVGSGSTFNLKLPCKLSDQPAFNKKSVQTVANSISRTATHFQGKILIAEDTPEMWILLTNILTQMGIDTVVAKNGQEAIEQAYNQAFDLILMDMQMPVMDGIEATARLRQTNYVQPIVAISANSTESHREQFRQAGCDEFLNKPIERPALLQVLRRYLRPVEVNDSEPHADKLITSELQQLFMKRLTVMASSVDLALDYEQWDEVRSIAHDLRGTASSFGYPALTQLGESVCYSIDNHWETRDDLTKQLLKELQVVLSSNASHP